MIIKKKDSGAVFITLISNSTLAYHVAINILNKYNASPNRGIQAVYCGLHENSIESYFWQIYNIAVSVLLWRHLLFASTKNKRMNEWIYKWINKKKIMWWQYTFALVAFSWAFLKFKEMFHAATNRLNVHNQPHAHTAGRLTLQKPGRSNFTSRFTHMFGEPLLICKRVRACCYIYIYIFYIAIVFCSFNSKRHGCHLQQRWVSLSLFARVDHVSTIPCYSA